MLLAERWLIAVLRHEKFFCLADLNQALAQLLEGLNQRPFRKREGTRASLYAALDRPALQPLPAERYVLAEWKTVRVNIDYHVEVERHYYSVPYQLVGEKLETRSTITMVEIFHMENGWPRTLAASPPTTTPPCTSTCPRAIRRMWSGPLHG